MIVQFPVSHLFGRRHDGLANCLVDIVEGQIGGRSGSLDNAKCADDRLWHGFLADGKVDQGPRGLGTVIFVGRHLERAKGVGFYSHIFHDLPFLGTGSLEEIDWHLSFIGNCGPVAMLVLLNLGRWNDSLKV